MAHFATIEALHVINDRRITLKICVTEFTGNIIMDKGDDFARVLEYQSLKHSLEQEGLIRPEHSSMAYILITFCAGCIVGLLLPW